MASVTESPQVDGSTTDVKNGPVAAGEAPSTGEDRRFSIAELRDLRRVNRWRAPLDIAVTWALILAFFALVAVYPSWWLLLLGAPILGAFQNRLTTLLHDAMHRSLHPKPKTSDFLGKWFCSYPCGNFFHINLIMHRNHHHEFGLQRDPNVLAYTVSRKTFLTRDLPKALFALGLLSALLNFNQKLANRFRYSEKQAAIADPERNLKKEALAKDYLRLPLVQLGLFGLFALAGIWWAYFYWVAVRVTWCAAFNTIRLWVEHHSDHSDAHPILANTADPHDPDSPVLVNMGAGLLERFFIAPLNFNLHGTHHVAPFVPYYQLPEITELIRERELKYCLTRKGYLSYLFGKESFVEEEMELIPVDRHLRRTPAE